MNKLSLAFKVGAVVLLAAGAFGFGLTLIGGKGLGGGNAYTVTAVFEDASGLGIRTRVQIAGIVIGTVEKIELDESDHARVFLRLQKKFKLYKDASINKRSDSILGDYLLDVRPGTKAAGPLEEGGEITNIVRQPGMNEVFASMGKIANDIQDITRSLKNVLASEQGESNLRAVVEGLARITKNLERVIDTSGNKLDQTLTNFRDFSGDLKTLTAGESDDVRRILQNTRDATAKANEILNSISQVVGSGQSGDVKDTVKSLKGNLEKLDKTLANVQSVTDKINRGEGTVGRLINDDTLIKNIEKASFNINNLLTKANDFKVEISTRTELLVGVINPKANVVQGFTDAAYNPWAKNYFNIRIIPRPDKWYGVELIDDPRGLVTLHKIQNCIGGGTPPNCSTSGTILNQFYPDTVQQITTERALKFSAYIAKRYGLVTARFGILENTGGFGLKLNLLNDDLVLASDIFEFANPLKPHPRLKLYADYRFLGHLMLTAGIDDLVNAAVEAPDQPSRIISGRDYFVGGGFYFTEDDFKVIFSAIGLFR